MELNYIREFVVLSHVLQFQDAAEMLFISQSSLSKHIKVIENELGQDLFIRSKRNVVLSDFGKAFLPYAKTIADTQKDYTEHLLHPEKDIKTFVIGYIPLVTFYTFLSFFCHFASKHPGYQYSFIQGSELELIQMLQEKKIDFALMSDTNIPESLYKKTKYTSDFLTVVLPEKHPLAGKSELSLEDIKNESFIQFSQFNSILSKFDQSGITLNTAITVDKENVLFDFIQKGLGLSILTKHMAEHCKTAHTVVRDLVPSYTFDFYMVCLKSSTSNKPTLAFEKYLNQKKEK